MDAIFTPIKNVRYTINQTRVGEKIDFEALTMEVTTDGSVLPEDSLALPHRFCVIM
jgi:DNA-directed RNA polymerase subunit alpha